MRKAKAETRDKKLKESDDQKNNADRSVRNTVFRRKNTIQ